MRTCVLCARPDRSDIEYEYAAGRRTLRDIAAQCNSNKESVRRHFMNHVPNKMAKAANKMEISDGINVINALIEQYEIVQRFLKQAIEGGKVAEVALMLKEGRKHIELSARLSGELNGPTTQVNLLNPEFIWLRDTVFNSLNPEDQLKLAAKLQAIKELEQ